MNDQKSPTGRLVLATDRPEDDQNATAEAVRNEESGANPGNARGDAALAAEHFRRGDFSAAETLYARAVSLDPENPSLQMDYAAALFAVNKYEQALLPLQASLQADPKQFAVWHNLGVALALTKRDGEAIKAYQRAIELAPGFIPAYMNLAGIRYKHKSYADARELTEKVIALGPEADIMVRAYCNLYDVDQKLNHSREACFQHLEKAMEACAGRPSEPLLYLNLAGYYELTHDLEACRDILHTALQRFPDCDQARYLLAVCHRRQEQYEQAIRLLSQCDPRKFAPGELAAIHFEFATCLHEQKSYEPAFRHMTQANRIAKSLHGLKPSRTLARAQNHYREMSAAWDSKTDHSWMEDPVFLLGFPRSGTTLLEQILDSHPQILTLEEKPVIRAVAKTLANINPASLMAAIDTLDDDGVQALRELYLRTRQQFAPGAEGQLLVDKLPLATINVPILYRLFPRARFILAVRHPLDCLLSCYMQNFAPNDAMNNFYDLDNAAELYRNTMGIWRKSAELLPLRYHQVRYEDLVENLENESRALLDFLQLPWDENLLNYRERAQNRGFINTPSYSQVTQPIYQKARYRWQHYAGQLAASKEKVQPFIEYFGY